MSRLGVAVIGLGVGEAHAAAYARLQQCELRWLCDLDAGRAGVVAERLGVGRASTDIDAVIADSAVQIVSIASYDDAHYGQVIAALRAGKHVFVEKPLCRTADEVCLIKRAWAVARRHLASNLVLRAAPAYRWLNDAVAAGELGEVYAFDGDYLYGRLHKITDGWRADVDEYSVMLGGGIHLVDLMLGLTGERPTAVAAIGSRVCSSGTAFRYDDYQAATFRFPSGLVGRITANFGCIHRHQHIVRVYGTKATFVHDDAGTRLHTSREPSVAVRLLDEMARPASKGELIPPFVERILAGADGRAEALREFDVVIACAAADRAARNGGEVAIEYV
jgi:predicted dehydrogenase